MKTEVYQTINFVVTGEPYPKMEPNITCKSWRPGQEHYPILDKEYPPALEPWLRAVEKEVDIQRYKLGMERPTFKNPRLTVVFFYRRPNSHLNDGIITASAKELCYTQWPSVTMLGRAIQDKLAGVLYESSISVHSVSFRKEWANVGPPRAEITVEAIRMVDDQQPELPLF